MSFTFFLLVLETQNSILQALPNSITAIFFPPINLDDLPEDCGTETRISLTVTRSLPFLRDSLSALAKTTRLVAMVIDIFGTNTFDVALEFNMLPYIFLPSMAMGLCFIFHLPSSTKRTLESIEIYLNRSNYPDVSRFMAGIFRTHYKTGKASHINGASISSNASTWLMGC